MPSGEILSLDARSCKPLQQIFRGYVAGIRAGQSASVYALTLVTARRETRRFSPPDIHVRLCVFEGEKISISNYLKEENATS